MYSLLIVDDNKPDREGIKRLVNFEQLGISSVLTAINGDEGYKKALEVRPDFIITDISMPIMNGIEMAQAVIKELPGVKIIFISCFDDFEYAKSAIEMSIFSYLLKPINEKELISAISKVVEDKNKDLAREKNQKQLQKMFDESLPFMQESFVSDILCGIVTNKDEIIERGNYLNICFKKYLSVIRLVIDNFESYTIEEKFLLLYDTKNTIKEKFLKIIDGYVFDNQYSGLAMLLFIDSADEDQAMDRILEAANLCKDYIKNTLNISVTIGIGGVSDDLSAAASMYNNAEYAIKSKFYSNGNKVFITSEVVGMEDMLNYDFKEIKLQLNSIIESEKSEYVEHFLDIYYNNKKHYREDHVKSFCFSVINILQILLIEKKASFQNIFDSEIIVWKKLSCFETILDIRQWMFNILNTVRIYISGRENSRFKKVVEDVKAIVDSEYNKIENINQIVDKIYMSAGYANHLYKKYTGETIFDYLVRKRMEVAKSLLEESNYKIYEISEMVGYKSKTYFTSIFKEYTGMLPKNYRNKHSK